MREFQYERRVTKIPERCCLFVAVLVLYFTQILMFSESKSKTIYHSFIFFVYFAPIFGAIIADSKFGKFRTILYLSIVYASGNAVISIAAIGPLALPQVAVSMLGLALLAIGTGGIKPCVAAFGGDQFILPEQVFISIEMVT